MTTKKCVQCGKDFEKPYSSSQKDWKERKYCSQKCFHDYKRETIICELCGKEFTRSKSYARGKVRFCSQLCSGNARKDRGGKIKTICKFCGKEFLARRHRTKQGKDIYCSSKCKDKDTRGKKHWNWKGGVARGHRQETKGYKEWRSAVYKRDYWTCQNCKKKQKQPVAHHLKSWKDYPELRFDIDNGITLCRSCHKKRHKEIGLKTQFS